MVGEVLVRTEAHSGHEHGQLLDNNKTKRNT